MRQGGEDPAVANAKLWAAFFTVRNTCQIFELDLRLCGGGFASCRSWLIGGGVIGLPSENARSVTQEGTFLRPRIRKRAVCHAVEASLAHLHPKTYDLSGSRGLPGSLPSEKARPVMTSRAFSDGKGSKRRFVRDNPCVFG